ncbi:MAG: hypothetical protein WBA74_11305 [Cyclobacteriaceae bacterium]
MQLKDKNILIISPESWTKVFVSKHHYAVKLAERGNRVFFLNPPSDSEQLKNTRVENVFSVDYKGFPPKFRRYPAPLRKYFLRKIFRKIEKICQSTIDIVWSFDNSVFFDLNFLPEQVVKISHIVDLNQDFEFAKAATSADICLGCTSVICEKQKQYNKHTFFVNHGFNNYEALPDSEEPVVTANENGRSVGYAGNLDIRYLDWHLIKEAVDKFTDVMFYFAGPTESAELKHWMEDKPNVRYIGVLDPSLLGAFYKQMDLLMISYKADEYRDQLGNPHKLMGYLGSGTAVVSTYTHEYRNHTQLISMSESNSEWISVLSRTLQDFAFWNSPESTQKRINFAMDNTYDKQVDRIEKYIAQCR